MTPHNQSQPNRSEGRITIADLVGRAVRARFGDFDLSAPKGAAGYITGSARVAARAMTDFARSSGHIFVDDFNESLAKHCLERFKADGELADSSVATIAHILSGLFRFGMLHGLASHNPFRFLSRDFVQKSLTLTAPEDINKFFTAAYSSDRLIFFGSILNRALGLRSGELLAATWGDFDLNAGQVYVRAADPSAKSRTVARNLPIQPSLLAILKQMPVFRPEDRVIPIEAEQYRRRYVRVFKKAGLTLFPSIQLRRWCIVEFLSSLSEQEFSAFNGAAPQMAEFLLLHYKGQKPNFFEFLGALIGPPTVFRRDDLK